MSLARLYTHPIGDKFITVLDSTGNNLAIKIRDKYP